MNPLIVSPSLLAADYRRLGEEVEAVTRAGADWLHLDMMDGHFVPNLSFGPGVVDSLKNGPLPLDVHLMVTNPGDYLESCTRLKATCMTIHAEACIHLQRMLSAIRKAGMLAGVALNPSTDPGFLKYLREDLDLVLVMTVNPGFGGQTFLPGMLEKVADIRKIVPDRVRLQVDGGVTHATAPACKAAGADTLVAGSAIFGTADYAASIRALR